MNKPISVAEAEAIVLKDLFKPSIESTDLSGATGRILAEDVSADRDFPPFNRVAMDGICIRFEDFLAGNRSFKSKGVQAAGEPPKNLTETNSCLEVMTGSSLPIGADTVIRYEDIQKQGDHFIIEIDDIKPQQNVHHKGLDQKKGDVLIKAGKKIGPAEIGILATVGLADVVVYSLPKVAIISTGDELVDVSQTPLPHQIRKSNVHVLESISANLGVKSKAFHLNDDIDVISSKLPELISEFDVLMMSGAVSKGKFDFLPELLRENGIDPLFHGVQQRPGKPFWFGKNESCFVFAFPGNPVSTTVCAMRYFTPWLKRSLGQKVKPEMAILAESVQFKPPLTFFLPVSIQEIDGIKHAYPQKGNGSGDLANLTRVDGFLELPENEIMHSANRIHPFHGW